MAAIFSILRGAREHFSFSLAHSFENSAEAVGRSIWPSREKRESISLSRRHVGSEIWPKQLIETFGIQQVRERLFLFLVGTWIGPHLAGADGSSSWLSEERESTRISLLSLACRSSIWPKHLASKEIEGERKEDNLLNTQPQLTTCMLPLGAALIAPPTSSNLLSLTPPSPNTLLNSLQALK